MSRKTGWFPLLPILAVFIGGVAWLLLGVLEGEGEFRHLASTADPATRETDAVRDVKKSGAAEGSDEADSGEEPASKEELPPYGDPSLPRHLSIRGRVLDAKERPVPDAVVEAAFRDVQSRPYEVGRPSRVRTREDGTYVLGPLEPRTYDVLAAKPGAGVAHRTGVQPGATVDLRLLGGATVRGRVTDRTSKKPVPGARVFLRSGSLQFETAAGEDGRFEATQLPPVQNAWSGYRVVIVADGYRRAEWTNLRLSTGAPRVLEALLDNGGTLTGTVTNLRTGEPVVGATVAEGWETFDRSTNTDAEGRYTLRGADLRPNRTFVAMARGYLPIDAEAHEGELNFALSESRSLEGRVWSPTGAPVPRARVYLHQVKRAPEVDAHSARPAPTTSDAEGRFRFDRVTAGKVAVIALHRDFAPGETPALDIPVDGPLPENVRVELKAGLTIRGRVVDASRDPLPDMQVRLYPSYSRMRSSGYRYARQYTWRSPNQAFTDAEGRFELVGVIPGKHWLYARAPQFGWAGTQTEGAEGQIVEGVEISYAGSFLAGRVVGEDGGPVPYVDVYARGKIQNRTRSYRTRTDGLGHFRMGGVEEGRYRLTVTGNLRAEPVEDVAAGTADVEIRLVPTTKLRLRVLARADRSAVGEFRVQISAKRGPRQPGVRRPPATNYNNQVRAPDGRFEWAVLPGNYTVTIRAQGFRPIRIEDILMQEGRTREEEEILLDRGGVISGVLRDASGKPVSRVWVNARVPRQPGAPADPTAWMRRLRDRTDRQGRFTLEGASPGDYLITVNRGNRGAVTRRVTVAGSEKVIANLDLAPTGKLSLVVVDEAGKRVNAWFQILDPGGSYLGWVSGNGRESQGIRHGPVLLKLHNRAYEAQEVTAHVTAHSTTALEITVRKKK